TQPNVDPSRATEATGAVAAIDAEGGDRAKSASRSRPASSRAPPPEPNARVYVNPSLDEVARRAYQRGRGTGSEDAFANWIQGERQLREEQLRREESIACSLVRSCRGTMCPPEGGRGSEWRPPQTRGDGRYVRGEGLGRGGVGVVYAARDR